MTSENYIELAIDCTRAPCRTFNPFHWALLRAVELFPPGARPGFDELSLRLRIGERAFLDEAWKDVLRHRATDDDDFVQARLSVAGGEAMRTGRFVLGEPVVRRHVLYFRSTDGGVLRIEKFEFSVVRDVRRPPSWGLALTTDRIADALSVQKPQEGLQPGEQILEFSADWSSAQEVRRQSASGRP